MSEGLSIAPLSRRAFVQVAGAAVLSISAVTIMGCKKKPTAQDFEDTVYVRPFTAQKYTVGGVIFNTKHDGHQHEMRLSLFAGSIYNMYSYCNEDLSTDDHWEVGTWRIEDGYLKLHDKTHDNDSAYRIDSDGSGYTLTRTDKDWVFHKE